jgi:hypothetical protein
MTTSEFIEMLKKADPSGKAHIRLPGGGVPIGAELKEGYWDGPYQMIDPIDKALVTTVAGMKVDIHVKDFSNIVWELNGDMEKIRKRIRFNFSSYSIPEQRIEKETRYWKHIEEEASFAKSNHEKSLVDWTDRVLKQYVFEGYRIRQPLDKPIGYYNCMTAHSLFNKPVVFCQGECMAIIESGKFYPEKEENYYVWIYDEEKGKNWSLK